MGLLKRVLLYFGSLVLLLCCTCQIVPLISIPCSIKSTETITSTKLLWSQLAIFTPQSLRAVGVLFSPMVSGWAGGRREKVCLGCISETVRCRKLILGRDIVRTCRCATSWSDRDLTFDLAVVTLSLKILFGLYLGNRKV